MESLCEEAKRLLDEFETNVADCDADGFDESVGEVSFPGAAGAAGAGCIASAAQWDLEEYVARKESTITEFPEEHGSGPQEESANDTSSANDTPEESANLTLEGSEANAFASLVVGGVSPRERERERECE